MALWGLKWHNDGRPDRWWEPNPQVRLWAFAASPKGAFVIVESTEKPHPDADLLNPAELRQEYGLSVGKNENQP